MKSTLENKLFNKFNNLLDSKMYISWRGFLDIQYEIAVEKHLYEKAHEIQDLIRKDIES